MASMVGGLDLHRRQITFDSPIPSPARCGGASYGGRTSTFPPLAGQEVAARAKGRRVELAVEGWTG